MIWFWKLVCAFAVTPFPSSSCLWRGLPQKFESLLVTAMAERRCEKDTTGMQGDYKKGGQFVPFRRLRLTSNCSLLDAGTISARRKDLWAKALVLPFCLGSKCIITRRSLSESWRRAGSEVGSTLRFLSCFFSIKFQFRFVFRLLFLRTFDGKKDSKNG